MHAYLANHRGVKARYLSRRHTKIDQLILTMKGTCILLLITVVCSVQARTTPNPLDLQAQFLRHLFQAAKARPRVNDEINFSADGYEVANVVSSIAGKEGISNSLS